MLNKMKILRKSSFHTTSLATRTLKAHRYKIATEHIHMNGRLSELIKIRIILGSTRQRPDTFGLGILFGIGLIYDTSQPGKVLIRNKTSPFDCLNKQNINPIN